MPLLKPNGDNTPQSQNHLASALQSVLKNTQELAGFLTESNRKNLEERNRKMAELIGELKVKVRERSEEIWYNFSDYEKRFCISDKTFEKILQQRILNDSGIKDTYDAIFALNSNLNRNSQNVFKKKLIKDYLEDLVYESLNVNDYGEIGNYLDLSGEKWENYNNFQLENTNEINLKSNNLGVLEKNKLFNLFSQLKNVKRIDLRRNNLGSTKTDKIHIIFSHLKNIKIIHLHENNLGNLDKNQIHTMFSPLKNVKFISLSWNDLGNLEKEQIDTMFSNLKNTSRITLRGNDLGQLGKDELNFMFSPLKNVKIISLDENNLSFLGKDKLNIIFSPLKNVKQIYLRGNNLSDDQKSLITSLLPNTKIDFGD